MRRRPRRAARAGFAGLLLSVVPVAQAALPDAPPVDDAVLARAMERFKADDFAASIVDLARLHAADPTDLDVTLLLGVALQRAGRGAEAEPLLRQIIDAPGTSAVDEESRATARVFLGLLERERGDTDAARAQLSAAARGPAPLLADAGRALLGQTGPRLLTLTFLLRPEFDSNVPLLPGTALAASAIADRADGDVLLLAAASLRPLRGVGLAIDETASYRQQLRLTDYDLFANLLGARYLFSGEHDRALVRYGFELMTLGGGLYTLGHLAQAGYRRALASELGLLAGYTFRHRSYQQDDYRPFSGPAHTGTLGLGWGTEERPTEVEARFVVLREDTADAGYSATGLGASLHARRRVGARVNLALNAWFVHRAFDAPAPPSPSDPARADWQLWGELSLLVDLTTHLGLIAGVTALRNLSTVADFDYLKLTAHVGLAAGWSGP